MQNELNTFLRLWDLENVRTQALLSSLPAGQYDFRPDPAGRSLGELAWHMAECEAYTSVGVERGDFQSAPKPQGIQRPRLTPELLPAFRVIHEDARARLVHLKEDDFDAEINYADGTRRKVGDILWGRLLLHQIHHRGQLALLVRQAGGVPAALYGSTREETLAARAAAAVR